MPTTMTLLISSFSLHPYKPRRTCPSGLCRSSMIVRAANLVPNNVFSGYSPTSAFIFPSQGAQAVGMGKEAQGLPAAVALYNKANDILGFNLLHVCINGPKEKLNSSVISQPAIYVTSLATVEILRARDGGQHIIDSVDVTCGLSLGEYTALDFTGAFSFEDGLINCGVKQCRKLLNADAAKSAMVSIIGLDAEKVQLLYNAANQDVDEENKVQGNYAVSGGLRGVEAVEAKAKSFKARMTV